MKEFDIIIIGFGKGGKTLAQEFANRGSKVALIEKSTSMYGGTCINVGCIPTKSLVHNSQRTNSNNTWEEKSIYFKKAMEEKRALVTTLRGKNYEMLQSNENISVIDGFASFIDPHTINIDLADGSKEKVQAQKIIINTGSIENRPKIEGIDLHGVHNSETLLDIDVLPKKLTIIGGGYIGLEFASMFASYGTEVTILEHNERLVKREDEDIASAVKAQLEKKGVKIIFEVDTKKIEREGENNIVTISHIKDSSIEKLSSDIVLVAVGRHPNTAGLNLEAAGVKTTERAAIDVNDTLQTSQPHIWALGDVVGKEQFTYISLDDSRIVLNQIVGDKSKTLKDRTAVPYSVFIDPPLSRVGINEDTAKKLGKNYVVATMPAMAIPRARLMNQMDGILKLIVDKDNGQILGSTLFCADSHEMINIVALAVKAGLRFEYLRDQIFTHPTMSESLNDLFKKINI